MKRAVGIGLERVLGVAFFVPAVLKALDMDAFATQILSYHVLEDHGAIRIAAWATLGLEAAIAALLILPTRLRWLSHGLALGMLTVFTGLIAYAWAFHGLTDCGCFGTYLAMSPATSMAKNGVMMAMSLTALWLLRGTAVVRRPHNTLAGIGSVAAILAVAGLALGSNDLSASNAGVRSGEPTASDSTDGAMRPFARFVYTDEFDPLDLGVGSYLVAFYSASCEHCMSTVPAANELATMPDFPPFVAIMYGKADQIREFRAMTQPQFPTISLSDDFHLDPLVFHDFLRDPAEGASLPPRFFYIVDGAEVAHWDSEPPTVADFISTYPDAVGG